MESGNLGINREGKIIIAGELFEDRDAGGIIIPFEGFLDTGCSYDLVIPKHLANGVFAKIENDESCNAAAGAAEINGTKRIVNIRFGKLEAKKIPVFVPNEESSRVLIGIGFLQKMQAFIGIDFCSGITAGGILTNDRTIPFLIGKFLHYKLKHGKEIISICPCEFCEEAKKV